MRRRLPESCSSWLSTCSSPRESSLISALWASTTSSKRATLACSWPTWIWCERWWTTSPAWAGSSRYPWNYVDRTTRKTRILSFACSTRYRLLPSWSAKTPSSTSPSPASSFSLSSASTTTCSRRVLAAKTSSPSCQWSTRTFLGRGD